MPIEELIALAKVRSGKNQTAMAEEMGHGSKHRLTKIAAGRLYADASELVYLATAAKLDPIKVLAEIESERHPELAGVWGNLITSAALYSEPLFAGPAGGTEKRRRKTRCNHALSNRLPHSKRSTDRFNSVSTLYK